MQNHMRRQKLQKNFKQKKKKRVMKLLHFFEIK